MILKRKKDIISLYFRSSLATSDPMMVVCLN